jgi:hypothetical protein
MILEILLLNFGFVNRKAAAGITMSPDSSDIAIIKVLELKNEEREKSGC